jgi:hypothetical protein
MSKVDDLLRDKKLTSEELKLHEDLIKECRRKEAAIGEISMTTRENLKKLSETLGVMGENLKRIGDAADNIVLIMMPEGAFSRE